VLIMTSRLFLLAVLAAPLAGSYSRAQGPDPKAVAAQARTVLQTYCVQCHNGTKESDLLNYKNLREEKVNDENYRIVPNKLDESLLWKKIGVAKDMPPRKVEKRPTEQDILVIKQWIESGGLDFNADGAAEQRARKPIPLGAVLAAMANHLDGLDREDRPYVRYFTMNHLYNNPEVTDDDLILYRAALSKAINSLSWKPRIVLPEPVKGTEYTVCWVDIRDLDWDRGNLWQKVMAADRYGLTYGNHKDRELTRIDDKISDLTHCERPYVRADWFINTATRPPLYHWLAQIPPFAYDLEKKLGVDVRRDFERNRLWRAGFDKSFISAQNRMIERHDALYGAYWKSYDFKQNKKNSKLATYPLGPVFEGNPYNHQAFQQAGGEIVFNLPNKLQGYMLVKDNDERIDAGPTDVVGDPQQISGNTEIVNGLSCIACHQWGMIWKNENKDNIRNGTGVLGEALRKVEKLYPEPEEWNRLIKIDEDRFLGALEESVGPVLRKDPRFKDAKVKQLPEPITRAAFLFLRPLDLTTVAAELGVEPDADKDGKVLVPAEAKLRNYIESNKRLWTLGLNVLIAKNGQGVIQRHDWEQARNSTLSGTSVFQLVAQELRLGTAFQYVDTRKE